MELIPDIKSYEWGKIGQESEVANLAALNTPDVPIDATKPYAEWWLGDHVSGPSIVKSSGESLTALITGDRSLVGGADKLPFLLKVLSIGKALSIQVHPSKAEAEILYKTRPDLYKDPNHKPELAIALTPFLALCGFRPSSELHANLKRLQPMVDLLGSENVEALKVSDDESLKKCFSVLMRSDSDAVKKTIEKLNAIFTASSFASTKESEIFLHLQKDFPNDVGVLSMFFLNILQLAPGQAIFLPAQEPHAYLDGNCVECMACSDNVIRAGLTPKFKDVDQLLRMLNYTGEPGAAKIFQPCRVDRFTEVFVPPVKDFAVAKIQIPRTQTAKYTFSNRVGGSLFIVLAGSAAADVEHFARLQLGRGSVFFAPAASTTIGLTVDAAATDGGDDFVAYQAMYNDFD